MAETGVINIELAWWFMPYIEMLLFFCWLMNCEPDEEKLERMIIRAIQVKPSRG